MNYNDIFNRVCVNVDIIFNKIINYVVRNYFMLLILLYGFLFLIIEFFFIFSPSKEMQISWFISDTINIQNILTMMGTINATILAISFSISIIVIQHAASNYTPSILQGYKRDFQTWFFLLYFLGSIILIITSIYYATNSFLIIITFITFIFSFLFLISQYMHIINLIDPIMIIKKAKIESLKDINQTPSKIESILKKKRPLNKFEEELIKSPLYYQFIFHQDKTLFSISRKKILQIFDVIFKACSRRELETSVFGFEALSRLASNYISLRKDHITESDDFIQYIYDQLLSVSEIAFEMKDISLLQEIIKIFGNIGGSATEIKSVAIMEGPNQTASLAIWYIAELGTKAIEKDFNEVSATAISSMTNVGILAIQKTMGDGLASSKILEIGLLGIQNKDWVIIRNALNGLKELCFESVLKIINIHKEPSMILEDIEKLALLSIEYNITHFAFFSLFPILPEYSIKKVALAAFQIKNEEYQEIETNAREEYSKKILSKLILTLGNMSITASKKNSFLLLNNIVDNILYITLLMLNEKMITIKEGYQDEILNVIENLRNSYLLCDETKNSPIPAEIKDAITTIAIFAIEIGKEQILIHCLKNLHLICISMVERDHYGYDVARVARNICIIGIYALHKEYINLTNFTVDLIINFDEIYLYKSPNPHDRLHIEGIKNIYERFQYEFPAIIGDTEQYGKLFKNVSVETLNKFTKLYEEKRKIQSNLLIYDCSKFLFKDFLKN